MILHCPAKINLFLAIRAKEVSGYHEIETVFARVPELFDEIDIEVAETMSTHFEPAYDIDPQNNSIIKAIHLLEERTKRRLSYAIRIKKNIPPQSGLGGGASNAATILLYLNEQEKLGLSREELMELGARVGMDVPFFISGYEVALGTHYGEKILPLPVLPQELKFSIQLTDKSIPTQEAYARWDLLGKKSEASSKILLASLQSGHVEGICAGLHNDFESITPERGAYDKDRHLSGSGGAVFIAEIV